MSAPIAKSQFAFELPNLTYVDAEPGGGQLPRPAAAGQAAWPASAWIAAFRAWREKQAAMAELDLMTDRELLDIGLSRSDVHRVFNDDYNQDLQDRLAA